MSYGVIKTKIFLGYCFVSEGFMTSEQSEWKKVQRLLSPTILL